VFCNWYALQNILVDEVQTDTNYGLYSNFTCDWQEEGLGVVHTGYNQKVTIQTLQCFIPLCSCLNLNTGFVGTGLCPSACTCDMGTFFHMLHQIKFTISFAIASFHCCASGPPNASCRVLGSSGSELSLVTKQRSSALWSSARWTVFVSFQCLHCQCVDQLWLPAVLVDWEQTLHPFVNSTVLGLDSLFSQG